MTTSEPAAQTATLTFEGLVKEHNLLIEMATENMLLRREVHALREYAAGLEALVQETMGEQPPEISPEETPDG